MTLFRLKSSSQKHLLTALQQSTQQPHFWRRWYGSHQQMRSSFQHIACGPLSTPQLAWLQFRHFLSSDGILLLYSYL